MNQRIVLVFGLSAALMSQAVAQQYVYPAKGQSAQQQKSDEAACYTWAVEQTGFDPAKPPPQQPAAKPPKHFECHCNGPRNPYCPDRTAYSPSPRRMP